MVATQLTVRSNIGLYRCASLDVQVKVTVTALLLLIGVWIAKPASAQEAQPGTPRHLHVILIHGIWGNGTTYWGYLGLSLVNAGYSVNTIDFGQLLGTTEGPIEAESAALGQLIAGIQQSDPNSKICLVGHSMGGLVARWYLHDPSLWLLRGSNGRAYPGVSKVILLGTPNWGTDIELASPVATEAVADYNSGADTINSWSPALCEMYAEWMPPPPTQHGVIKYPPGFSNMLYQWRLTAYDGYISPISNESLDFAALVAAFYPNLALDEALAEFDLSARPRFVTHKDYYESLEKVLGPFTVPHGVVDPVDGVNVIHVSPFLKNLNRSTIGENHVKFYLAAGRSSVTATFDGIDVPSPYPGKYSSDGVVPLYSALGINPIDGTKLFPYSPANTFIDNHDQLLTDPKVLKQIEEWLGPPS